MAWKLEEKIFCVTTYIETKSYKTVQARFRRKFNFNTYPGKSQIFLWYRNFQIYGTVNKRSKKLENPSSGRKLSARSADNVEASRVSVGRSPKKSIRRRSSELGISRSSLHRILTQDLNLYPYRFSNEGLWAVGTGLLDEHSEKDATNQALALSAFLKNISLVDCRYAIAR